MILLKGLSAHTLAFLYIATTTSQVVNGCTVFYVGKDASIDGSVMITHSNDGEFDTDPRLVNVPARHNIATTSTTSTTPTRPIYFSPESYPRHVGTTRQIPEYYPIGDQIEMEPIGFIPEVSSTFAYLEQTYGAVNEHQVGIGESTCSAIFGAIPLGAPNGTALLSIDELTRIAMERSTSARQAVQLMGDLAVEFGFYGAGAFEGTGEALVVSDTEEVWMFHILPDPSGTSAIWAAQRIPSTGFGVLANMFVLRELDRDSEEFLMSESVHRVAQEYGWWHPHDGNLLDFTQIYSDGEYSHKYYSGRRMWGAYHLAAPSLTLSPVYDDLVSSPYPLFVTPDALISLTDLFTFHRYTYQNTPYDLGAVGNLAGGPFGSPNRWNKGIDEAQVGGHWERSIGLHRTSDSYVVQSSSLRQDAVLWFGPASALSTIYVPFVVDMEIPPSYRSGIQEVFSRSSAFWASCVIQNISNLKWKPMMDVVQTVQQTLERDSLQLVTDLLANDANAQDVESELIANAANVVETAWKLSDDLLFQFASGFYNDPSSNVMGETDGYPAWWLKAVGFRDGPPPPPTLTKCCRPPAGWEDDGYGGVNGDGSQRERERYENVVTGKEAMKAFLRDEPAQTT